MVARIISTFIMYSLFRKECSSFIIRIPQRRNVFNRFVKNKIFSNKNNRIGARYPCSSSSNNPLMVGDGAVGSSDQKIEQKEKNDVVVVPRKFVPFPFQYHDELILEVSSLTNLGIGVCRTDANTTKIPSSINSDNNTEIPLNWVVMVPNVIPGERIRARIYRNHKQYSDADLKDILDPSPHRITPPCSLYSICGGCQYQHVTIEYQRQWKTSHVQELYQRIGGLNETSSILSPTVGTSKTYHYRSKISPHYDAPKNNPGREIRAIGFKEKTTRRIVDVPYCFIATHDINFKLKEMREDLFLQAIEGRLKKYNKGATLLLREANEGVVTDPNQYVTTTVDDLKFKFLAGNFFQNNPDMVPVMVRYTVEAAIAGPDKMKYLIDCYCGSGLFCLSASSSFDVCVGIEVNDRAVEEARANAELNSISNCKFVAASAEAIFESEEPISTEGTQCVSDFPRGETVVVLDPPRKGCSMEFLDQLCRYGPQRVVYMSCDPATQARDAKILVEEGGYMVKSIQPFDLFPQTRHIECLTVFEKQME